MFSYSTRAAAALFALAVTTAPATAGDAATPSGFLGFEKAGVWGADQVDFAGASQVSTFDMTYGARAAAPGLATTAHGAIDWAHRETLNAASDRVSQRNRRWRGGIASFDQAPRTGGFGLGVGR